MRAMALNGGHQLLTHGIIRHSNAITPHFPWESLGVGGEGGGVVHCVAGVVAGGGRGHQPPQPVMARRGGGSAADSVTWEAAV